jgi:hypothetical protein
MGAIVFPPLPAFYHRPTTIDEIVDDTVERVLALLGIEGAAPKAWSRPLACRDQAALSSQARRAPNTAFGYSGRPRLPL